MGSLRRSSRRKKGSHRKKSRKSSTKRRTRSRSRSNRKVLKEYERLLFQPLSNTPFSLDSNAAANPFSQTPMLPVNESKHQLVKQATYGGYSWNRSRKISNPKLRSFLQEHHVSSTISNPFQKVCGPSKSSIAYPVIYTKDELVRQALSKGHTLEQVDHLTVPKLCDLLELSGKPIYVKPLEQLSKKLSSPSDCHSKTKSHLIRLAVKHGYSKAMSQKATKKDLCDLLGLSDASSKTNALLATQVTQSQTTTEKINPFYEVEDSSSCSLFSSRGETGCNVVKLRSSGILACDYDNVSKLCMSKKVPVTPLTPSTSDMNINDFLKRIKDLEKEKEMLIKIKDQTPFNERDEKEKEIQKLRYTIQSLEQQLKTLQSTQASQPAQLSQPAQPFQTTQPAQSAQPAQQNTSSVSFIDSEIEKKVKILSPDDPTYKAYLFNKEKYFQLEQDEKDIKEQQRQNESDIRSDEQSDLGVSSSDPKYQAHLTNRVVLSTKLAKKQEEILNVSQSMREQLKIMRSLLETPPSSTSTSLYLPSAIHTRLRRQRL